MKAQHQIHNIKLWLVENWVILTTLTCIQLLVTFAYGCTPKTGSLLSPEHKVTRGEFKSELEVILARYEHGLNNLDQQEKLRKMLFEQTIIIAQGNPINPAGVIMTALSIFGVGAAADDVRLRRQRKKTNGVTTEKTT